jgi:hypothetical protein
MRSDVADVKYRLNLKTAGAGIRLDAAHSDVMRYSAIARRYARTASYWSGIRT